MQRFYGRQTEAFALALLLISSTVPLGCSSNGSNSAAPCQEGRSVLCTCSDGREGSQVCQNDGSWGPCRCDGSDEQADANGGEVDSGLADTMGDAEGDGAEADADAGADGPLAPFGLDAGFADPSWLETAELGVVKVTNLANSGEGSLPWAVEQPGVEPPN